LNVTLTDWLNVRFSWICHVQENEFLDIPPSESPAVSTTNCICSPAAIVQGDGAPGVSSGTGLAIIAQSLPALLPKLIVDVVGLVLRRENTMCPVEPSGTNGFDVGNCACGHTWIASAVPAERSTSATASNLRPPTGLIDR